LSKSGTPIQSSINKEASIVNKKVVFSTLISIVLVLSVFSPSTPAKAAPTAAVTCSCVDYVKNYFGITENVGHAYQMGTWLLNHGFVQIPNPEIGAVAVMQSSFISPPYGHVGIITGYSSVNNNTQWRITLRGANQTGTAFTDLNCSNVFHTTYKAYNKTDSRIKYYKAYKYAIRSAMPGSSRLYFDINGGSTSGGANVIGWTYHGGTNQLFNALWYGDGYRIISRHSAMCIQPEHTGQGAKLIQRKCVGSSIEKWRLIYTSSGYVLQNYRTGYVADLAGGSLNPGTWILAWSRHNGANQKWWFESK
jgi:hypothetical protein